MITDIRLGFYMLSLGIIGAFSLENLPYAMIGLGGALIVFELGEEAIARKRR